MTPVAFWLTSYWLASPVTGALRGVAEERPALPNVGCCWESPLQRKCRTIDDGYHPGETDWSERRLRAFGRVVSGIAGYADVSHGCINLSRDSTAWYLDTVHVGDPIIVQ